MEILNARLKGFIGFKKGLGIDEVSVDMSGLSGLIALAGQNGKGKTTLLENLQPFRTVASRKGALYQHVFLRDSEKDLTFRFQGNEYRTLIKIDAKTERQEGFVWKNGSSEVNGKVSEYDTYIAKLLGSSTLFFNSVFCAQNSDKMSDLTAGQLKALFSEFLRLDRYVAYEAAAKQRANIVAAKIADIDIKVASLHEKIIAKENLLAEIERNNDLLTALSADLDREKGALVSCRLEAEKLKEIISRNALVIQRKADITANVERLQKELGKEKTAAEAEIEALRAKYRELQSEIAKHEAVLKDKDLINSTSVKEKELDEYLEKTIPETERIAAEITKHADTIHNIERQADELSVKLGLADPVLLSLDNEIRDISLKISEKEQQIKDIDNDKQAFDFENTINNCREKIATLDLKDPACQSKTCSFIVSALEASKELPVLERSLQQHLELLAAGRINMLADIRLLKTQLEHAKKDHAKRTASVDKEKNQISEEKAKTERELNAESLVRLSKEDILTDIRQNINKVRAELVRVKGLAGKQPDIRVAESRKADLEKLMLENISQGKTIAAAWAAKEIARKADIGELMAKIAQTEKEIDAEAEGKLKGLNGNIESIEKVELPGIEKSILGNRERIAALQSELVKINDAEKELEEVQQKKEQLVNEVSEWVYLKNACGKNGLQALEIDSVAPVITGYANEYTLSAFGPNSAIKVRTLDDDSKECFDILIIDEDGEEVALGNRSGGQKVWPLKALRLAMSSINRDKSGRDFKTVFADEEDGALDSEKAVSFVKLYRAFIQQSDFKTCCYISHKRECVNLADHIINFTGEGITVE